MEQIMAMLIFLEKMVGGTGVEPVAPTMSRFAAQAKSLINIKQTASKYIVCSRYTPVNHGQFRANTGRDVVDPPGLKFSEISQQNRMSVSQTSRFRGFENTIGTFDGP